MCRCLFAWVHVVESARDRECQRERSRVRGKRSHLWSSCKSPMMQLQHQQHNCNRELWSQKQKKKFQRVQTNFSVAPWIDLPNYAGVCQVTNLSNIYCQNIILFSHNIHSKHELQLPSLNEKVMRDWGQKQHFRVQRSHDSTTNKAHVRWIAGTVESVLLVKCPCNKVRVCWYTIFLCEILMLPVRDSWLPSHLHASRSGSRTGRVTALKYIAMSVLNIDNRPTDWWSDGQTAQKTEEEEKRTRNWTNEQHGKLKI